MYTTQRMSVQGNSIEETFKGFGRNILFAIESVSRGIKAAKIAEKNPEAREEILRVLNGE